MYVLYCTCGWVGGWWMDGWEPTHSEPPPAPATCCQGRQLNGLVSSREEWVSRGGRRGESCLCRIMYVLPW